MAKRLTEIQKKELIKGFKSGKTAESLSEVFNCTKLTVIRNLKKELGENVYKELIIKKKLNNNENIHGQSKNLKDSFNKLEQKTSKNIFTESKTLDDSKSESNLLPFSEFVEIAPLNCEIENTNRKEISSVPIEQIEFPKIVYMIVDNNIELEIKLLKDYPNWDFLPNEDLKRKTIEIFFDLKTAKRVCTKAQKVIKVPNTDVFRIVSPILISRGITRIVSDEKLIAL